jgi:hypothetical protein
VPTVPYDRAQIQEQGLPGVRVSVDAPIESFGGGQALQAADQATQGVASVSHEIAKTAKDQADQVAFMAADKQLSELETKLQIQSKQMLGKDAAKAPDVVSEAWTKNISDITQGLSNETQKMAFNKAANSRWDSLNKHVQTHVSDQLQKFDDDTTSSYIATSRQNMALNFDDDQTLKMEMDRQKFALAKWADRKGIPQDSDIFKAKLNEEFSASHRGVVEARLNAGDNDEAKEYFDANKGTMAAADILHVEKAIENADVIGKGMEMYEQVKGLKLSDGTTPDESKMRAAVYALDGITDKRKEKIWDFVKGRASEDMANKNRQEMAVDRSFMNAALDARKKGVPMAEAMKLTQQFGTDDYDQSVKADAIRKIYAPPSQSDPEKFINLWEQVQSGGSSKQTLDEAFHKNDINVADWRHLREEYFKQNTEGKNVQMVNTLERIKVLSEEKFGSNKQNRDAFMYEIHQAKEGKTPEELWKIANDKLKGDPSTGIWGMFKTAQWKTDLAKSDAQNLAWGSVHQDIGKDVATAIGRGVLSTGKEKYGLGDIDSFAAQFGGYDKIKAGTPVNNAVKALMDRNRFVTPEAVKTVLNLFPDGNVPKPKGVAGQ